MPVFGAKNCHEPVSLRIADYLTRDDRALATDCVNMGKRKDWSNNWAKQMDRDRNMLGASTKRKGTKDRTYFHFLISPDPRDAVDKDMLMALAKDWAKEFFGNEVEDGKIATAEYAIVIHDDNENRIPHAHIIVNNVDFATGKRIQIDPKTNEHTMPDYLQELSAEYGLRYFGDGEERECPTEKKGRWLTKAERKIEKQGGYSWKQDIRNAIDVASRTSIDKESFVTALSNLGFDVRTSVDGEAVYSHRANPARWNCKARRLGKAYTPEFIQEKLSERRTERTEKINRNVQAALVRAFFEGMDRSIVIDEGSKLAEVAKALHINSEYGIRCFADYDRVVKDLYGKAYRETPRLGHPDKTYLEAANKVKQAKAIAATAAFFKGVSDLPARRDLRAGPGYGSSRSVDDDYTPTRTQSRSQPVSRGRGR